MTIEQNLNEAIRLANKVFNPKPHQAHEWFQTPNEHLFNEAPFQLIMSGRGDHVIQYLRTMERTPDARNN